MPPLPGILAASILVLVRTVGMFELTFLTAGPDSQTLVVALFLALATNWIPLLHDAGPASSPRACTLTRNSGGNFPT